MKTHRGTALMMALVMMAVMMIGMVPAYAGIPPIPDVYVEPITWDTVAEVLQEGGRAYGLVFNIISLDGFAKNDLKGKAVITMYDGWKFEVLWVGGKAIKVFYDGKIFYLLKQFCTPYEYEAPGSPLVT